MTLERLDLPIENDRPLDSRVVAFLRASEARIDAFLRGARRVPYMGFYPSDHEAVHGALRAVRELDGPPTTFCEWGSGFGVVAGLAALLGYDATGIEIDARLVKASRELLEEHGLDVEVHEGSFVPAGHEFPEYDPGWQTLFDEGEGAAVDVDIEDFDVVFAYPWPGEEDVFYELFESRAALGAVLVTYEGLNGVFVRRKMR